MSREVTVARRPPCDFCGAPAEVDGRTARGPWANMCGPHWERYGCGQLGTGHGQRLVVRREVEGEAVEVEPPEQLDAQALDVEPPDVEAPDVEPFPRWGVLAVRYALVASAPERVADYLPQHYQVVGRAEFLGRTCTLIAGVDRAGWTLDGYVLPRLASGLHVGAEVLTGPAASSPASAPQRPAVCPDPPPGPEGAA